MIPACCERVGSGLSQLLPHLKTISACAREPQAARREPGHLEDLLRMRPNNITILLYNADIEHIPGSVSGAGRGGTPREAQGHFPRGNSEHTNPREELLRRMCGRRRRFGGGAPTASLERFDGAAFGDGGGTWVQKACGEKTVGTNTEGESRKEPKTNPRVGMTYNSK